MHLMDIFIQMKCHKLTISAEIENR